MIRKKLEVRKERRRRRMLMMICTIWKWIPQRRLTTHHHQQKMENSSKMESALNQPQMPLLMKPTTQNSPIKRVKRRRVLLGQEEQECCDEQVLRQGQDRQGWQQCCQRADLHQSEAVQVPRVPARPSRQASTWHAGGGRRLRPQARHLPRDEGRPCWSQVQGIQDCQDRQWQRA